MSQFRANNKRFYPFIIVAFLPLFLPVNDALALRAAYEGYVSTDFLKTEFLGTSAGEQLGATLATGDFNNDNIDDVFIGSPFSSTGGKQWNGKVSIVYGKAYSDSVPDSQDRSFDVSFYGENDGDQLGTSLEVGDFNGDSVDDLSIGAYNALYKGNRPGKVYIMYGHAQLGSQVDKVVPIQMYMHEVDFAYVKPDLQLTGAKPEDKFGLSMQSLDLNNDGIEDLLIGAPNADSPNKKNFLKNSGVVYAYFGSKEGVSPTNKIVFYGQDPGEAFGSNIAGAKVKDGKSAVFIAAYLADKDKINNVGKVYYYKPLEVFNQDVNLPSYVFEGNTENEWLGFALNTGDLDDDKIDDLAISSFPFNGVKHKAKVAFYYGKNGFNGQIDIVVKDSIEEALVGSSVLIRDLNSDGKGDIVIGAPGVALTRSSDEGDVYVVYSTDTDYEKIYSVANNEMSSYIHGENEDDWFGFSIEALDFNNDGYQDLAVGSRYSDGPLSVNNGRVFVLFGDDSPYGNVKAVLDNKNQGVNRGDFVKIILESFNLKEKKSEFIKNCYEFLDFCLFNFTAMSSFDGIQTKPQVILYPDVPPTHEHYIDITMATMLGWVNGYMDDANSPFYAGRPISRIQALKVILGATDLVVPIYKFELVALLGSYKDLLGQKSYFKDIDSKINRMWWYMRYVNFAVENGIISANEYFRPDDDITVEELNSLISRTMDFIKSRDEEIDS